MIPKVSQTGNYKNHIAFAQFTDSVAYLLRETTAFLLSTLMAVCFWASCYEVPAQKTTESGDIDISPCGQQKAEQDRLISEAIEKQYNIRRIEISGNTSIRHREFTKRMESNFSEGDIFTLEALEKSIKRISKMKLIYPITLKNVKIFLDPKYVNVDFVICVVQKPNRK
jgi:Surface antigen variable number repeat